MTNTVLNKLLLIYKYSNRAHYSCLMLTKSFELYICYTFEYLWSSVKQVSITTVWMTMLTLYIIWNQSDDYVNENMHLPFIALTMRNEDQNQW